MILVPPATGMEKGLAYRRGEPFCFVMPPSPITFQREPGTRPVDALPGLAVLFCPQCELIIAHQEELETLLVASFEQRDPSVIGNAYLVLGTVDPRAWREGLRQPKAIADMLPFAADFKGYRTIEYEPGGWFPAKESSRSSKPRGKHRA